MKQKVFINAALATMTGGQASVDLIKDGALAVSGDRIAWVGLASQLPDSYQTWPQEDVLGRLITPGLIDCHTHIIHAGDRAEEFEMRLNGASYEDISRAGGGINSTVLQTRRASQESLLVSALKRVDALMSEGVTTLEIKSGYGLDIDNELKMLRVARQIAEVRPLRVKTSYLAAHALPPEYKNDPDGYIDDVCIAGLIAAKAEGLVDAVDGFCETIAFNTEQIERVFKVAKTLDIPVKLHAEQLSNLGGAELVSHYDGLSADHLEYLEESGVQAMARSNTIAVMLPGAFYTLGETRLPPIEVFRKAGVPMAVATDCNPGSSPLTSLLLAMNMACTLFKMTPAEALSGTTSHAAQALGLMDCGELRAGLRADLAIWNADHPAQLSYRVGFNPLYKRIFGGAE